MQSLFTIFKQWEIIMSKTINSSEEVFNTMHKLEQAGMSRVQAETTARAVDRQISNGVQMVLEKLDQMRKDNIIANTVIGIGFVGIIVSLIGIMFALLSLK